jgi:hypothetical protein
MRWENDVPVAFHADYGDTVLVRPFQRFVKRTQPKLTIIGDLAFGIIMVQE